MNSTFAMLPTFSCNRRPGGATMHMVSTRPIARSVAQLRKNGVTGGTRTATTPGSTDLRDESTTPRSGKKDNNHRTKRLSNCVQAGTKAGSPAIRLARRTIFLITAVRASLGGFPRAMRRL